MSGFTELRDLGVVFRPFDGQPPALGYRDSPFSASWASTVELLADELRHLDAEQVVIELALEDRDLRVDGLPRANARLTSPAVRVSFGSKWGPLRYETGEYQDTSWRRVPGWQANVRAVALSMEALRKVDRYGVSKRGEQYRGWRAIAQTSQGFSSREQALEWIESHGGYREAARKLHPDNAQTGDEEEFKKLQQARELVGSDAVNEPTKVTVTLTATAPSGIEYEARLNRAELKVTKRKSYDQRDDRAYTTVLEFPVEDWPAVRDLLDAATAEIPT